MSNARQFASGMSRIVALTLAAGTLLLLFPAPPAVAQDSNLARQVERLRRDLNDLQRFVYKGGEAPEGGESAAAATDSGVTARMQVQITQMQEQMRSMNGRVEEVEHRMLVLEQRLDRMAQDLEVRLQEIEDRVGGVATADGGNEVAVDDGASDSGNLGTTPEASVLAGMPDDSSPRQQYDYAFELLKQRDYDSAAVALQAFLDRNPDDQLAGNALYWLGETRYVQKDYKEAAKVFLEGYKRFPEGTKAPDNLLKLGMSLAALDETESACKTFVKLESSFPDAPSRVLRAADSEQKKLKCQ